MEGLVIEHPLYKQLNFSAQLFTHAFLGYLTSKTLKPNVLAHSESSNIFPIHPQDVICLFSYNYIHKSLIRPILDYGSPIYGLATPSYLKLLDTVQTSSIRIATGDFSTNPALSPCAEAGIPPLSYRRQYTACFKINATDIFFQQDGARGHTLRETIEYLRSFFGDRLISSDLEART